MYTEAYNRDGIAYVISIYEQDDRYHAGWTCRACNVSRGLPDLFWSAAEAIRHAQTSLFTDHHVTVHKQSP
jgi:hypothetical protein